ncbi:hypothetical protein [Streptomyces sp. NPDC001020]
MSREVFDAPGERATCRCTLGPSVPSTPVRKTMPPNPTAVLARKTRRDRAVRAFAGPHQTPGAACESARTGAAQVADLGPVR